MKNQVDINTLPPRQNKRRRRKLQSLSFQAKVDQILVAVTTQPPQNTETPTPQPLIDRIEVLETR